MLLRSLLYLFQTLSFLKTSIPPRPRKQPHCRNSWHCRILPPQKPSKSAKKRWQIPARLYARSLPEALPTSPAWLIRKPPDILKLFSSTFPLGPSGRRSLKAPALLPTTQQPPPGPCHNTYIPQACRQNGLCPPSFPQAPGISETRCRSSHR